MTSLNHNDVDYNEDPSVVYYKPEHSEGIALNLVMFGIETFGHALRIKEFENFKSLNCTVEELVQRQNETFLFTLENLMDNIRIVTAFENYMKAKLLTRNFLIHKVKTGLKEYKQLAIDQKNRPIHVNEILSIGQWQEKKNPSLVKYFHPAVYYQTLMISNMLNEKYQEIIGLPKNVFDIINKYKNYRNNLHFYMKGHLIMSNELIAELECLKAFVQTEFMNLYKTLNEKVK